MKLDLRDWQAKAAPDLIEAILDGVNGLVVATTGSGKSILMAFVIDKVMDEIDGAIIVATSGAPLVQQLSGPKGLGRVIRPEHIGAYYGSEKRWRQKVIVTTYASLPTLAEVLRNHRRPVGLLICDEAHKTETERIHDAVATLGDCRRQGYTATPFRSSKAQRLSLWDKILVRYEPADALRDKVIVPWRLVDWRSGDDPLDDAMMSLIRTETEGPGVVNAASVADAQQFARKLVDAGIPAAAIYGALSPDDRANRLRALEKGRVRVLVYPNLLSEGFDAPWLRWIGFRRNLGARVRFIQEVGRVLRAAPGKDIATILDPRGIFQRLSLTYNEALGWETEEEPDAPGEHGTAGERNRKDAEEIMATATGAVSSWCRTLFLAAEAEGVAKSKITMSPAMRDRPASAGQVEALRQHAPSAVKWLPVEHAEAVSQIAQRGCLPSMGIASDLLEVVFGLRRRRMNWHPACEVEVLNLELLDKAVAELDGDWWSGAVSAWGRRAIAVVCGRRTVYLDHAEGTGSLTRAAAAAAKQAARLAGEGATVRVSHKPALRLLSERAAPLAFEDLAHWPAPEVDYVLADESDNPAVKACWGALRRAVRRSA